jgi:hypothetical protein
LIQHRQLLGDTHGIVHRNQRPEHRDPRIVHHLAECRGENNRIGSLQQRRVMMLGATNPIETQLVGQSYLFQ